jgi:hypothetical protein
MYMNYFALFAIEMKLCIFLLSIGFPKRVPTHFTVTFAYLYPLCINDDTTVCLTQTLVSGGHSDLHSEQFPSVEYID